MRSLLRGGVLIVALWCQIESWAQAQTEESLNCCLPPYAFFDCTGNGHEVSPGKLYTCVSTAALVGCMSCLGKVDYRDGTCTTCCAVQDEAQCRDLESDWEFYASTLFFVCLCCCFTALCGFTEVRRKKKGISFAEAWSVPQAMPILRTWPRRSVSASDILTPGQGEGQHWTPLSDDEEDIKHYPVAGLVDDSGMAFGFVTSMPQSLLGTVTSLRHSRSGRNLSPPSPQEPELTVWMSRDGGGATIAPSDSVGATAVVATRADGRMERGETGSPAREEDSTSAVGNDLQEPLIFGDGPGPGRGDRGEGGVVSSSSAVGQGVGAAEARSSV